MANTERPQLKKTDRARFRGMNHNYEWVYGDVVHASNNTDHLCIVQSLDDYHPEQIYPESLGQFTGYFDRFHTPIYEGDVILPLEGPDGEMTVRFIDCGWYAVDPVHKNLLSYYEYTYIRDYPDEDHILDVDIIGSSFHKYIGEIKE